MISALPDVKKMTLTDEDEFMVLACDGIWNSMTSDDVVKFIKAKLTENPNISLKQICEEVGLLSKVPYVLRKYLLIHKIRIRSRNLTIIPSITLR